MIMLTECCDKLKTAHVCNTEWFKTVVLMMTWRDIFNYGKKAMKDFTNSKDKVMISVTKSDTGSDRLKINDLQVSAKTLKSSNNLHTLHKTAEKWAEKWDDHEKFHYWNNTKGDGLYGG